LCHSTLGPRVIKKKKRLLRTGTERRDSAGGAYSLGHQPCKGDHIVFFYCRDLYHTSRAPVQIKGLKRAIGSRSEGWWERGGAARPLARISLSLSLSLSRARSLSLPLSEIVRAWRNHQHSLVALCLSSVHTVGCYLCPQYASREYMGKFGQPPRRNV
jgi:hypothetical protein